MVCGGRNSTKNFVSCRSNIAAFTHEAGRDHNEDGFLVAIRRGKILLAVADGVGGNPGGNVASRLALDTTQRYWRRGLPLETAVTLASLEIQRQSLLDDQLKGMGSTIVAAEIAGDDASIISSGDSRAFLAGANAAVTLLTEDHSYAPWHYGIAAPIVCPGYPLLQFPLTDPEKYYEFSRYFAQRNLIWSFAGLPEMELFQHAFKLNKGDRLLLCSDGLAVLPYHGFAETFTHPLPPEMIVNDLFKKAYDYMCCYNCGDNIALVLYEHNA